MTNQDDMEEYRAHLETVTTAEEAEAEIREQRRCVRVAEYIGPATTVYPGFWNGLGALHARLRLAERHAKALAARLSHVPVAGGPNGGGARKQRHTGQAGRK